MQIPPKTGKPPEAICYKGFISGTPEGIRTPGLLIRSQALYPAELRVHCLSPNGVRGKSHKATLSSSQRVKKDDFFTISPCCCLSQRFVGLDTGL